MLPYALSFIMPHNTNNFSVAEFACKHCGKNEIEQRVINMAQAIREALGVPVRVNSGYRCEIHNSRVGGAKKIIDKNGRVIKKGSNHMYGLAADLSCSLGAAKMFDTVKKLHAEGKLQDLDYCIWYRRKNFIHIDCGGKRNSLWEIRP